MSKDKDDAINEADLILVNGLLCCNAALYPKWPACLGCSGKGECLCLVEQICLKAGTDPLLCKTPEDQYCQCGIVCCSLGIKRFNKMLCLKGQFHVCCFVTAAALPTDSEVPVTCALCGLACYPKVKCCAPFKELMH